MAPRAAVIVLVASVAVFGCSGLCPSIGWQFTDMMIDGTQDPKATCDGVSVSFGFEAELATEGDGVTVPIVEGAPCAG